MIADRLALIPLLLGHVALFVLLINVTHALGHREHVMSKVKLTLLTVYMVGSGILAYEAWRGPVLAWSWPSLVYGSVCLLTGLILFPSVTIYAHLRPRPVFAHQVAREINFAREQGRDAVIGEGRYAWMLRIPGNESLHLRKIECELPVPGLPAALDGLTILHFSDLHLAPCFRRRFFERVLEVAAGWPIDLALFTGDLVDSEQVVGWIEPLFKQVHGRLGSFAILGNHDLEHDPVQLGRVLEAAGYTNLEGRWATVSEAGRTIALGGTSYPWGPQLPLNAIPEADFRIVLSHAPDQFYRLADANIDLMLSGHNHGGQIRLPLIGSIFMPSRYSRRFDRGYFARGQLRLHVSQGIAGKHPIRYGCVPEVTRLTLRTIDAGGATNEHASAQARLSLSGRS